MGRGIVFEEACVFVIFRQEELTRHEVPSWPNCFVPVFIFPFDSLAPARSALAGLRLWRIPFVASQATQVSPPFAGLVIPCVSTGKEEGRMQNEETERIVSGGVSRLQRLDLIGDFHSGLHPGL